MLCQCILYDVLQYIQIEKQTKDFGEEIPAKIDSEKV